MPEENLTRLYNTLRDALETLELLKIVLPRNTELYSMVENSVLAIQKDLF